MRPITIGEMVMVDGQGGGITATGSLSVVITDKNGTKINRGDTLTICSSPYKVVLTSTAGSLSTQYGSPNTSTFTRASATYLINPAADPVVCFARPSMTFSTQEYAGPATIWDTENGFLTQSTTPASYGSNFPTTGANGLYFDLEIAGSGPLTWVPVTSGGITATMTPNASGTRVQVKLTGPAPTAAQQKSATPGLVPRPTLPATFELEGKSGGTTVVKYGFVIKKWFINRGTILATATQHTEWCVNSGYGIPSAADLTNASGGGWTGATPSSGANHYMRHIGSGLITEWGSMTTYSGVGFAFSYRGYWVSDTTGPYQFFVYSTNGLVFEIYPFRIGYAVCTQPGQ